MKRFRLTYNGITSEFNGSNCGVFRSTVGNKTTSYGHTYSVRPSKTNVMKVTKLIEKHNEDGSVSWSFNCNTRIPRGLEVNVEII